MMNRKTHPRIILSFLIFVFLPAIAAGQEMTLLEKKDVIAIVNGEPITIEQFKRELAEAHKNAGEKGKGISKDGSELLRRIINAKLVVQEGKNIGLDALPEVKSNLDAYEKITLRDMLYAHPLRNIKVNEREVEKIYRKNMKEIKIKSVLIEKEEDAKELEKEIHRGGSYDNLIQKMIEEGKTKGDITDRYVKLMDLSSEISKVVSKMKAGEVSPLVKTGDYFTMMKIEEIRFHEIPEEREKARQEVIRQSNVKHLEKYKKGLWKKYVKVHKKTLNRVDYESEKPGFQKLLEDRRVVAEVMGEKPVTVGDLTKGIDEKFYHSVDESHKLKKFNKMKENVLKEILFKKIILKEAIRLKIDKHQEYLDKINDYQDSLIFGSFIRKVIYPEIIIDEKELRAYYSSHILDFTFPETITISSLVFKDRDSAESAFEKLNKGSDFYWIKSNAEGQVLQNPGEAPITLDREELSTHTMSEGMRKSVDGGKAGDYRFYADENGVFHVLRIWDMIPPKPRDFAEVKKTVWEKIFQEKADKLFAEWVEKLRVASDIEIFASGSQLLNFPGK